MHAAIRQDGHVRDGRRMRPHGPVHRRRHQHRRGGGQQRGPGEVVGHPGGHARQPVGRGRGDHHDVVPARQGDMATPLALLLQRPEILRQGPVGDGLQRVRGDEARPARGQQPGHRGPGLAEQAGELQRLEGGHGARDDQQDALAVQHGGRCSRHAADGPGAGAGDGRPLVARMWGCYAGMLFALALPRRGTPPMAPHRTGLPTPNPRRGAAP